MKIILITAAAEASCCCILVSGVVFAAEMWDANNKRSFNLSEFKKQRCLNLWKITHFQNLHQTNKFPIQLTDPQVSVPNFKLLMRWNKHSLNFFQQLRAINVQTAFFCNFCSCIPNTSRI